MALYNDLLPPKVGSVQSVPTNGVQYYENVHDYLTALSADVYNQHTWDGWSIRASGETQSVGPATAANAVRQANGYSIYAVPVQFPTAGALTAYFTVPELGSTLHIVMQATVRPTTVAANTTGWLGIRLDVLTDRSYVGTNGASIPESAWTQIPQYSSDRWSNWVFHSHAGMSTAGGYFTFLDLVPNGVYRLRPMFGVITGAVLPDTGVQQLVADPAVAPSQFQFYWKVGT